MIIQCPSCYFYQELGHEPKPSDVLFENVHYVSCPKCKRGEEPKEAEAFAKRMQEIADTPTVIIPVGAD